MPQPLSSVRPDAGIFLGNNFDNPSDQRPGLALLAMKVIAEWSILESFMQSLFVTMLGANPRPAATIYASLKGAQKDAFRALADTILVSQDERDVFEAILKLRDTVGKLRDRIAHGVWGHSNNIPDGVLLCDSEDWMEHQVALREYTEALETHLLSAPRVGASDLESRPEIPKLPLDQIFVWYERDFVNASAQIQQVMEYVVRFRFVLMRNHPVNQDGQELQRLLSQPPILEHVSRLRERRKNNQAAQQ